MNNQEDKKKQNSRGKGPTDRHVRPFLEDLASTSETDALNRLLSHKKGHLIVRNMANTDLFWLIKKIGEDDALPILRMADNGQWQYLLDMELWKNDLLDANQITLWLDRLHQADGDRLVEWLYHEGQWLTYHYLFHEVQVFHKDTEDTFEPPEGAFTVDDLLYVRIFEEDHRAVIEGLLRHMARVDYDRYYAFLTTLEGIIPAEHEEEMFRRRNVRLAQEGFLPFDEAISAYSHLNIDALACGGDRSHEIKITKTAYPSLVPVSPIIDAPAQSLFVRTMGEIGDSILMDRIRLEFAGLCNQLTSADGVPVESMETLVEICRKAAGYITIALEKISGEDPGKALQILKKNSVLSVFQAGFGAALELSWKARRWVPQSWFNSSGLEFSFWGESWGGCLSGLMEKRPKHFIGHGSETPYKDFESLSEINVSQQILDRITALDRFLEKLNKQYPLNAEDRKAPVFEFHNLLLNLWARHELHLAPGFDSLSIQEVRDFFHHIRGGKQKPPYTMPGFRQKYVRDLLAYVQDWPQRDRRRLGEILGLLWDKFTDEYAWVAKADLDGRYMHFVLAPPSSEKGAAQ